ncbi:A disintegrin and metalloproteinase with thrombospondin motifs 16 [Mizuhopecten yessoensis]|uniref:A disintegrin and metalloproteinase with thrombospondin motifs 16 n=2 Tax=Mizuhopecten yessoensis TaxID=6573 RepID=A0A210PLN6_MIZYE|nr:A disintegrin and metalloproteinase with thrombospondin motifs 16 [Mizuhopecten yessoensis]
MASAVWTCVRIIGLIWISVHGCLSQNDTTIEVAVVEDNLPANEQESPSLPTNLNMTINLFQNNTNEVDLKLNMNDAMNEQRSIYVIRTNKAGTQYLKKEQIPIEGNIAFYQDAATGANVMVRCDGYSTDKCDPTLEGSFFVDKVEYGLEPLAFDSPERKRRSASGGKRSGKLYSVFKRKQDKPVKDDFQKETAVGPEGQSMQLVDRIVDLSEFLNPESASMSMWKRVSNINTNRPRKQRKHSNIPYEMGLVVVIDFSVYQSWYRRSSQKTHAEKDIDAKSKIRQYMSHVVNGIDLRFKNLRTNRMRVVVSRFVIADTPSSSRWTSDRFKAQPRDLIYADEVLNKLIKWRFRMGTDLPVHDHTILFTGYDLYRPTIANKGVAGFARVKSMCSHTSVSIVEEHGGFNSILTATHEIGHSLGAYHDGHNNTCIGEDNYIMTPIGGSATPSNALNPFQFSSCSEDAFQSFLDKLPQHNCLTDETDIYDDEEFQEHLSQQPGQLYGPNEQCQQHLGKDSYYAWGGILGDASEVCTHMACKNSMSDTSFNVYYAARGTSCGNKHWCIDGVCTYSEEAQVRKETCVHGDAWRKFGNRTCAQYIKEDKSKCYLSYYNRFCCDTCDKLRRKERDCEFGNRKKMCDIVDQEARFCYHNDNERMCCESCKRHHTGVKDCEYGDRLPDCNPMRCPDQNYATKCCKTCGQMNQKTTTIVPESSQSVVSSTDHRNKIDRSSTKLEQNNIQTNVLPELALPIRHNRKTQDNSLVPREEIRLVTQPTPPSLSQNSRNTRPLKQIKSDASTNKLNTAMGRSIYQRKPKNQTKLKTTYNSQSMNATEPTAQIMVSSASTAREHWKQQQKLKKEQEQLRRQRQSVHSRKRPSKSYNVPKFTHHTNNIGRSSKHPSYRTTTLVTLLSGTHRMNFKSASKTCIKPNATFMSLKCRWLVKLMKGLCTNALLGSICCEPCEPSKKKEFVCTDQQGCTASTASHCYNDMTRSKCCATCKRFETAYSDCRYGDREPHCRLFLRYMPAYTCGAFKHKCCLSCKKNIVQLTTTPPKVVPRRSDNDRPSYRSPGIPHSSFRDRNLRFSQSRNHRRW